MRHKLYLTLVLIAAALFALETDTGAQGVGTYRFPTVTRSGSSLLVIAWTGGTLNNGGHAVAITAGTAAVTASRADCAAPAFASCNIVYASSAGSVSVNSTATTGMAAVQMVGGNTILALVETNGTTITRIAYPSQFSTGPGAAAGKMFQDCGTTATCSNTVSKPRILYGHAPLAANGVLTVSAIAPAFTSSTSYACVATLSAGTSGVTITQGTSTITFTYPGAATHEVYYNCTGN